MSSMSTHALPLLTHSWHPFNCYTRRVPTHLWYELFVLNTSSSDSAKVDSEYTPAVAAAADRQR